MWTKDVWCIAALGHATEEGKDKVEDKEDEEAEKDADCDMDAIVRCIVDCIPSRLWNRFRTDWLIAVFQHCPPLVMVEVTEGDPLDDGSEDSKLDSSPKSEAEEEGESDAKGRPPWNKFQLDKRIKKF